MTRSFLIRSLTGVLLATALAGAAHAQRGRWEYLGEANVDGDRDRDRIRVGRGDGRFGAIQLRVERAAIEFNRVVVRYGSGQEQRLDIRDRIRAGGRSRVIDLPGDRRVIESVEFWYERARSGSARPKVRLFGRR